MKRMAAMALAAVVLLALASPVFARWGNDEFYPGDDPPRSDRSPACERGAADRTCSDPNAHNPAGSHGNSNSQAYLSPGAKDGK